MTKDEVLEMGACEQLDIFVAKKVFGYQVFQEHDLYFIATSRAIFDDMRKHNMVGISGIGHDPPEECWKLPRYSLVMDDAWQVVYRMIKEGHDFELYYDFSGGWSCHFTGIGLLQNEDTAALAICKAAILTVMEM